MYTFVSIKTDGGMLSKCIVNRLFIRILNSRCQLLNVDLAVMAGILV